MADTIIGTESVSAGQSRAIRSVSSTVGRLSRRRLGAGSSITLLLIRSRSCGCYQAATTAGRAREIQANHGLGQFRLILRSYVVLDCPRWGRWRTADRADRVHGERETRRNAVACVRSEE